MAYIPVPDVLQVELNYSMSGERTQTVLHYQKPAPYTPETALALLEDINSYWRASLADQFPSSMILESIRGVDLSAIDGFVVTSTTSLPAAGTRSGAQLPNNVALVLTKRTANRGRSFRGRIYHGPLTETDVTGNNPATAFVNSLVSDYSGLISRTVAAVVNRMVVVSRFTNNAPRTTGISTDVTSLTCENVLDSQRRRLPGRGQ